MKRHWEIDALRGLMLVLITITHLPTRLSQPLGQPFGFVSAAEGFVLLSATMAGMVYSAIAARSGRPAMRRAFLRRALRVYLAQAAVLLFLFTVIAWIGLRIDQSAVKNLMSFYLLNPYTGVWAGLALLYEPPLLDILPMYILFMLVSPWALGLALRYGWRGPLAVSTALWTLSQFGLSQWLYGWAVAWTGLPVPYREMGAFDTFSWQLLWMVGLWMGSRYTTPGIAPLRFPAWLLAGALAIALTGLLWRHFGAYGQTPFAQGNVLNALFDKWRLGPARCLNLLALGIVLLRWGPAWAHALPRLRALETLGSASLAVFCAHLVAVLLTLTWFGGDPLARPWWGDVLLLVAVFVGLYAVARVSLQVSRQRRERPSQPAVLE